MKQRHSVPIEAAMHLFACIQSDMASLYVDREEEAISVQDFILHMNRYAAIHIRTLAKNVTRAIEASEEAGLGALSFADEMDVHVQIMNSELTPKLTLVHKHEDDKEKEEGAIPTRQGRGIQSSDPQDERLPDAG